MIYILGRALASLPRALWILDVRIKVAVGPFGSWTIGRKLQLDPMDL